MLGLLGLGSLPLSCAQGEGERCELPSDCKDGLVCSGTGQDKVCMATDDTTRTTDARATSDVTLPDAGQSSGADGAPAADTAPAATDVAPADGAPAAPAASDAADAAPDGGAADAGDAGDAGPG